MNTVKKTNSVLYDICKNYHPRVPLEQIFEVLKEKGFTPLQEDETTWEGFLCGETGRVNITLFNTITNKIIKQCLQLSWYKLTYQYEVNAYIL